MKTRTWCATVLICAALLVCLPARAQTQTNVTATIKDPLGIPYANGTYNIQLIPSGTNPSVNGAAIGGAFNGALDATGSLNVSLWPNASITPPGTLWQFTVCIPGGIPAPLGTGGQCTPPTIVTIAGASQSLSATLTAVAPQLTSISFGGGGTPTLDQVLNPVASKTFTLGTNSLAFTGSGGITLTNTGASQGVTLQNTAASGSVTIQNNTGATGGVVNVANFNTTGSVNITDVRGLGIFLQASSATTGLIQLSIGSGNRPEITLNNSGTTLLDNVAGGSTQIGEAGSGGILIQSSNAGPTTFGVTLSSSDTTNGVIVDTFGPLALDSHFGAGALALHTNATGGLTVQRAAGSVLTGQNATESASITSITVTEGIVTAITGTSDARLKRNIQPFQRGLDAILAIHPKTYQWNPIGLTLTNFSPTLVQAGFIAQDVQKAIPEAIGREGDYLSLDTRPILAALVNAVRELARENATLRDRVAALDTKR